MSTNKIQGFTLIELMIVIAIIAILVAFAFPAYRDYLVRAKAGEGINMSSGLKSTISEMWVNTKSLTGIDSGTNGIGVATDYMGTHVSQIEVDEGIIEVTFKDDPILAGQTLTMRPLLPGSGGNAGSSLIWQCSSSLNNRYLPVECRTP